jgi:hypothetical protein
LSDGASEIFLREGLDRFSRGGTDFARRVTLSQPLHEDRACGEAKQLAANQGAGQKNCGSGYDCEAYHGKAPWSPHWPGYDLAKIIATPFICGVYAA